MTLVAVFSDAIKDLRAFEMGHRIGMERGSREKEASKNEVKVPPKKLTNN